MTVLLIITYFLRPEFPKIILLKNTTAGRPETGSDFRVLVVRNWPGRVVMMVRMSAEVSMPVVLVHHPGKQQCSGKSDAGPDPVHCGYAALRGGFVSGMKHKLAEEDEPDANKVECKQPVIFVTVPGWKESGHTDWHYR